MFEQKICYIDGELVIESNGYKKAEEAWNKRFMDFDNFRYIVTNNEIIPIYIPTSSPDKLNEDEIIQVQKYYNGKAGKTEIRPSFCHVYRTIEEIMREYYDAEAIVEKYKEEIKSKITNNTGGL